MATLFSKLNPTPTFPSRTGPYDVGTLDVEIPTACLDPCIGPPDPNVSTVQFRIFYPCDSPSTKDGKAVYWIPEPQREHLAAFVRFLGAGTVSADLFSYFPTLISRITIPVAANAPLRAPPTTSKRWPVMIFSHGLGGTRNLYSHLLVSLASHGAVIFAPEHRDGSAPITYQREFRNEMDSIVSTKHTFDYQNLPHSHTKEVEVSRNHQLRIRLWELSLIHEAILRLDQGLLNLDSNGLWEPNRTLQPSKSVMFTGSLDVRDPGKIIWAGHSFGAVTVVQLIKSVFYSSELPSTQNPLLRLGERPHITHQINANSAAILLDIWCLPLKFIPELFNKPMPCYTASHPEGLPVLAIMSEAFFKWNPNLKNLRRLLSPDPSKPIQGEPRVGPHIFYPASSAHLSQSDFGVLFPWLTKRIFKAQEPERTLRLNLRAMLQLISNNGTEVVPASALEREVTDIGQGEYSEDDSVILDKSGKVRGWIPVGLLPDRRSGEGQVNPDKVISPAEAVMEGEVVKS
ncbi:MAG: hypothetical protein M1824_005454 [Vezdaea acicularis]|nr:MAG: hypothetical protein M1824_005454 [Vezdaea acicularis]